ncbi:hypothetical protein H072_3847 [Dactylellina haptotyla CBS 200.50]|uniref:Uncharacterized protein n=1 Tax=Dactylellina haptotyla (strain CBS 200.50) TaxID=1284197 RepID=S8AM51_DACHA|nr:hypothetical protein H072_3847 [Dactylellina haptotyla CBS 200.50]
MGWLWSSSGSSSDGDKPKTQDTRTAISNLDPSLQDYFKSSTPKDKPTIPAPEPEQLPTPTILSPEENGRPRESVRREYAETPAPHSRSSYGDRYADYWATYKGSEGTKVDSNDMRMRDFVNGWKQMRQNISAAASENCSIEEIELHDCYRNGTWSQRVRMCTEQSQKLSKCLNQQTEFLKALGYLTVPGRDIAVDERIQMHADKLYRQQLALDDATKAALKDGRNIDEAVAKVKAAQALEPSTPDYSKMASTSKKD